MAGKGKIIGIIEKRKGQWLSGIQFRIGEAEEFLRAMKQFYIIL
jgi:hypothetical protein